MTAPLTTVDSPVTAIPVAGSPAHYYKRPTEIYSCLGRVGPVYTAYATLAQLLGVQHRHET